MTTVYSDKPPRILIIRRDNIGDLVCTTPLIHALRMRFPRAWIGALVNSYTAPVLDGNPDLDEVFSYQKAKHLARGKSIFGKSIFGESILGLYIKRLRMLFALRRQGIDYVILASPGYQTSAERLARMVAPRHIVGFDNGSGLADKTVPARADGTLHQVENTFRLLRVFDIDGAPPPLKLVPDSNLVSAFRKRLPATEATAGPVVGVHISARARDRRWQDAHFAELINILIVEHHATVVLTWAPGRQDNPQFPGDDDSVQGIASRCDSARLLALPTSGLPELIASLALCDYVVCSDGGPVHLAAALGKPVICLFGRENPELWYPWGVPYRVLQAPSRNVVDISVADVANAFSELKAGTPAPIA